MMNRIRGIVRPVQLFKSLQIVNKGFKGGTDISSDSKKKWQTAFRHYVMYNPSVADLVESFFQTEFEVIRFRPEFEDDTPILISVIKNDIERVKMSIEHHRKIGIKKFVYLDNDSTDGTYEYLLSQNDVDLFRTSVKYNSHKKYGWINRLLAYYGHNRWYLYVDSDELLVYRDCEKVKIVQFLNNVKKLGSVRCNGIMVDMYSDKLLFQSTSKYTDIQKDMRFFDTSSYITVSHSKGLIVRGGPRMRVFGDDMFLSKSPLFYFCENMIFENAHFLYPRVDNVLWNCSLLHYKFLEGDLEKYQQIVKNGNYAGGSIHYKRILDQYANGEGFSFYCEESKEFCSSNDLEDIAILKDY